MPDFESQYARSQQRMQKIMLEEAVKKSKPKYTVAFYMAHNYFMTNNGVQILGFFKNYTEIEQALVDFAKKTQSLGKAICMVYSADSKYSTGRGVVVFGKPLKILGVSEKGSVSETVLTHVKF